MDYKELKKIDKKYRVFILSDEFLSSMKSNGDTRLVQSIIKLQTRLLKSSEKAKSRKEEILVKYRYIIGHEWEVVVGMSQYGVGDLLFTDGKDNYLVMEVKNLSPYSGKNQSVKRRKSRRKVEQQTEYYMSKYRRKNSEAKSIMESLWLVMNGLSTHIKVKLENI